MIANITNKERKGTKELFLLQAYYPSNGSVIAGFYCIRDDTVAEDD